MDYDFSSLNKMLAEFSDKIKAVPTPNLSPEFLAALDNFSHNPQISSIQEATRKFQVYYSNLYNPDLTATAISQAASNALNINIPYDYDSISKAVSAMASYAKTLTALNTTTSGLDTIVSAVSSALGSLDKTTTSSEENSNDYIELSEPLVDIVQQIDSSIELPKADENNVVRVSRIDRNTVLSVLNIIISVIMALYTIQADISSAQESSQQHNESLEQDQRQHEENLRQDQQQYEEVMRELHCQTEILEQIEQNTSADADSQEFTTATKQSE